MADFKYEIVEHIGTLSKSAKRLEKGTEQDFVEWWRTKI